MKGKNRNHIYKYNLEERRCYFYDNVLEVNSSLKTMKFYPRLFFPIPRYILSTIPSFIESPPIRLKIKDSWLYFYLNFWVIWCSCRCRFRCRCKFVIYFDFQAWLNFILISLILETIFSSCLVSREYNPGYTHSIL